MPCYIRYLFTVVYILFQTWPYSISASEFPFTEFSNNVNVNGAGGKPPVFYADNGNHQTIAFPLNRNRERREFQSEILQFLGLSHEPQPKKTISVRSDDGARTDEVVVPLYMLDMYKNLENENEEDEDEEVFANGQPTFSFLNGERKANVNHPSPAEELFDPSSADTIMSFVNQETSNHETDASQRLGRFSLSSAHPYLQHLHFDLSEVRPGFQLIGAELRIFYNGTTANAGNRGGRLSVFALKPLSYEQTGGSIDEDPLLLLATAFVESAARSQWLLLNVTNAISMWQNSLDSVIRKDLILLLETANADGYRLPPDNFGLSSAFVVGFFNGGNEHAHQRKSRKRRAAGYRGVSRREDYEWPSAWTNFDAKWSRSICQKRTLYVSFRDLGWQDWIIAPDGYAAYYCYGECSFPLNAHMNASNHAIVQTLAHLMNPESVPKPCCAPNKLQPISVLYFDDSNNVVLKKYNNMVVKSCGCH